MIKTIIHLSDLHFRQNWEEDQGVVLAAFFKDVGKQVNHLDKSNVYIAFSGDVVLGGHTMELYDNLLIRFEDELNKLNIPKRQRICVPGNHDISQAVVFGSLVEHEGVVSQRLSERDFNDYVSKPDNIFAKKFGNYLTFQERFADMGVPGDSVTGAGWDIDDNIAVYCLNSALCSSAGLEKDGTKLEDKGRLAIDTRRLQKWNLDCKASTKILIMHHPMEWLLGWAQAELTKIVDSNFSLCLCGHQHNQGMLYSISNDSPSIKCSAPPLLTDKYGDLGYSMIRVDSLEGVVDITYRQWTKYRSFVSGVTFSNTDDGIVRIRKSENGNGSAKSKQEKVIHDLLVRHLSKRLQDALQSFSTQPTVWVEPILNKIDQVSAMDDPDTALEPHATTSDIVSNPKSIIIMAPPQYGLTCLAHYLCKEAWIQEGTHWVYLDSANLKPHSIEKAIKGEAKQLACEIKDIKCIILDSWSDLEKNSVILLQRLCALYPEVPIIVMETVGAERFLSNTGIEQYNRQFEVLHLWALPRSHVRKIVSDYNSQRYVGDVDSVITRITSDLEVLNLPRTPLNCLTLLKVSEVDFDVSPVNRTELIDRILFLLFNIDDIPTYKVRPDLKDCEYVLGYFCETMIREDNFVFTRKDFLTKLKAFCEDKIIDLDIEVVFDVLHRNSILIERGGSFCFRFTYWIFYFAAQRMHHDVHFAKFILEDMRYASFPEVIEFYTGIDRRREDALAVLVKDINSVYCQVDEKVGFHKELNPYKFAQWNPSKESLEKVQNVLSDGVRESLLPDSVKDQYADRNYDPARPYHQEIRKILREYSVSTLFQVITAGARGIRNSDYAHPAVKRELLQSVMQSIELISKICVVLSPVLAMRGCVSFDGTNFVLVGHFGDSPEKIFSNVLSNIPHSILSKFQNDLFSRKMGPLLIDRLNDENTDLTKHNLVLLLIDQRPREWKSHVQSYIAAVSKNSFYLMDVGRALLSEYRYSFASQKTLEDIKYLIKMVMVKHDFGVKEPGVKAISKISDRSLPSRRGD